MSDNISLLQARREILATNHLASDKELNATLQIVARLCNQVTGTGRLKAGWNVSTSLEDDKLVGGGSGALKRRLHRCGYFCPRPGRKYGKLKCQRLLPPGHKGPCPTCSFPTESSSSGKSRKKSVHHYFDMAEYYKIIFQSTDLAQRIVDYWPISISRLSVDPGDPAAKVYCAESGKVAREDFKARPGNFQLDIEAKVGEIAYLRDDAGGSLVRVKVEDETEDQYKVTLPNGRPAFVQKSRVEKIGGSIPLNVIVFDDAAEVYRSVHMVYSNCARTEEIQNIAEFLRMKPEFCGVWGFTSGGGSHYNVNERNVMYEKQRRALQVRIV